MGYGSLFNIARFWAFVVLGAVGKCGKSHTTEVWVSSVLDEDAMMDCEGRVLSNFTDSAIHCLAISQALEWGQASCFSKDRPEAQCRTWGDDALKSVAAQWNGTVGTTTCKMRQSFVLCSPNNGSYIKINDSYATECDKVFICTENGLKLIESLKSCSEPFENTSAGCLYIESATMDWCSARQNCKALGGDLYTANTTEEFEKLRTYLEERNTTYGELWVAVKKIDDEWQWLPGGRNPGPENHGDWATTDSNGAHNNEECARTVKNRGFKLGDDSCENNNVNSICSVVLN